MGAWGHGSFENDDASDWLYELEDSTDLSVVSRALRTILREPSRNLESPECCNALAAAEIVAALAGKPGRCLSEIAQLWVQNNPLPLGDTVSQAKAAVFRVRSNSELRELWEETDDFDNWLKTLDELVTRL